MPHPQAKESGFQQDHSENCSLGDSGKGCAGWLLTGKLEETDSNNSRYLQTQKLLAQRMYESFPCTRVGLLNLGTIDIWGWIDHKNSNVNYGTE